MEYLLLLQIKHFICDFPLQAFPYQYENKGSYGHLCGLLHAGMHALGTFSIFCWDNILLAFILGITDFFVHYHIDWAKMNINKHYNLKPDNSQWFWILLGADQLLHQLTYVGFVWLM